MVEPTPPGRSQRSNPATVAMGALVLALAVNLLTALLGVVALAGYVFIYTPMKRVTSVATVLGAIPGAMPPMMGWTAVTGSIDRQAGRLAGETIDLLHELHTAGPGR